MIKAIVSDFSRVILFTQEAHDGKSHKGLYEQISQQANYDMFDYFKVNEDLLAFYRSMKETHGVSLHIFTTDTISHDTQFDRHLKPLFTNIYSAKQIGLKKDNPESYKKILQEIGVSPKEAIYTDDKLENVEAAKLAGLHAFHYQNNEGLMVRIKALIG